VESFFDLKAKIEKGKTTIKKLKLLLEYFNF